MFSLIKKLPSVARKAPLLTRSHYGYHGRPREQLSIMETWGHAVAIISGILFVPVWVLTHVKEYRGIDNLKE